MKINNNNNNNNNNIITTIIIILKEKGLKDNYRGMSLDCTKKGDLHLITLKLNLCFD